MVDYNEYLQSEEWQAIRRRAIEHACGVCEECGETESLEVHHLHYETLGHESISDLQVLCPLCHAEADDERREENQRQFDEDRLESRAEGWAYKVYGSDWHLTRDMNEIIDKFQEWLDENGYE